MPPFGGPLRSRSSTTLRNISARVVHQRLYGKPGGVGVTVHSTPI
jgi:hypothetical protein